MPEAPILFCHYGNSDYLPYVMEMARRTNPEKRIILLGDDANGWLAGATGIEHIHYQDLDYGPRLDVFHEHFRVVEGPSHGHMKGGKNWLKFVFERWFFVLNLLEDQSFDRFWHFDSDTMIAVPLVDHEARLAEYECTEQCNGKCINGFISSVPFIRRYLDKINDVFQDEAYLEATQKELNENVPHGSINEMFVYDVFKKELQVRSTRLANETDGGTFDDCVCQSHDMEMETLFSGKSIKRIFAAPGGRFYAKHTNGDFLKLFTLNLSWVPNELFDTVLRHAKDSEGSIGDLDREEIAKAPTLSQLMWRKHFFKSYYIHAKSQTKAFRRRLMGRRV